MSREIKVSPSMASKLFAVSERSIRRAIKKKELPVSVHKARYHISLYDLILWTENLPNRQRKRDQDGIGQFVEKWKF